MLQTQNQKTSEEQGIKLPPVSEREKAGKEFDDKGKDIEATKRGTKDDPRLKLVTEKQKSVELDLVLRNPNADPTKKMHELRNYFVKHRINVVNPEYAKGIEALQGVIQGNTKLMDAETFKAVKKDFDSSVAHTTALTSERAKDANAKDSETKLRESYVLLFSKDVKK